MTAFSEKDIPILDRILDLVLEEDYIVPQQVKNDPHFQNMSWKKVELEFDRLMYYFEYFGCAKCTPKGPRIINAQIRINSRTSNFKGSGGFKKAFESLLAKEIHADLVRKKEINEGRLAKWQVKTFWWFFAFGAIGLLYSIYDGFFKTQKIDNQINKTETGIKQNTEAIKELKTLIINQKRLDSLSNTRTKTDTIIAGQ